MLVRWNEPYQKLATCDVTGIIFVWIKHDGRWSIELINDRSSQVQHTRRFQSHRLHCQIRSWASRSRSRTPASVTKQCNFVLVEGRWRSKARKVTVGLALHWPCITDFVVNLSMCSKTQKREMRWARDKEYELEYINGKRWLAAYTCTQRVKFSAWPTSWRRLTFSQVSRVNSRSGFAVSLVLVINTIIIIIVIFMADGLRAQSH